MAAVNRRYYQNGVDNTVYYGDDGTTSSRSSPPSSTNIAAWIAVGFAASAIATVLIYTKRRRQWEEDQHIRDEKAALEVARLNDLSLQRKRAYSNAFTAAASGGSSSNNNPPPPGSTPVNLDKDAPLLKQLCPSPYEALFVEANGTMNCYKPCPDQFETWALSPSAEDEFTVQVTYVNGQPISTAPTSDTDTDKDGNPIIKPSAYLICRAICPPSIDKDGKIDAPTSDVDDGSACFRGSSVRSMGYGPDIVKCGWTIPYQGKNFDRACGDNNPSPDCQHGRQDTSLGTDAKQSFCIQWYGPSNSRTNLMMAPVACGGDYELLPAHPAAFFTKNMGNGAAGYKGFNPAGMRCFERCPPGSFLIPSGPKEKHMCSQPCPKNTREHPTSPTSCIKDGFKKEIVLEDLGKEIARILQRTTGA